MTELKPMTVGDWENEVECLIKRLQQLELSRNMDNTFEAGTVSGCQYARGRLSTLLGISRGNIKIDEHVSRFYKESSGE